MKIFSICLAILFWFIIRNEKQKEITVNIPVRYQSIPEGLVMSESPVDMVRVKLRGSKTRLSKMDDEFFSPYQINMEGAVSGKNTFRLYPEDFKVPFGVTIDRIQPAVININMEKLALRTVPIKPKLVGQPPAGFVVKSVRAVPFELQVQSFESQLKQIDSFSTEPIQLAGHQKSFDGDFKIESKGFKLSANDQIVKVFVEIEEKKDVKTISSVPIHVSSQDQAMIKKLKASLSPTIVNIKATGPESRLEYLSKNPPQVMLDRKQLSAALKSKKDSKIDVEMNKVEGVQFELEPSVVKLVYPRKK